MTLLECRSTWWPVGTAVGSGRRAHATASKTIDGWPAIAAELVRLSTVPADKGSISMLFATMATDHRGMAWRDKKSLLAAHAVTWDVDEPGADVGPLLRFLDEGGYLCLVQRRAGKVHAHVPIEPAWVDAEDYARRVETLYRHVGVVRDWRLRLPYQPVFPYQPSAEKGPVQTLRDVRTGRALDLGGFAPHETRRQAARRLGGALAHDDVARSVEYARVLLREAGGEHDRAADSYERWHCPRASEHSSPDAESTVLLYPDGGFRCVRSSCDLHAHLRAEHAARYSHWSQVRNRVEATGAWALAKPPEGLVSAEQAARELKIELDRLRPEQNAVFEIPCGSGKTRTAVLWAIEQCEADRELRVAILEPTHEAARDAVERYDAEAAALNVSLRHAAGSSHGCVNEGALAEARSALASPAELGWCQRCAMFPACPVNPIERAKVWEAPGVIVSVHALAAKARAKGIDRILIDESPSPVRRVDVSPLEVSRFDEVVDGWACSEELRRARYEGVLPEEGAGSLWPWWRVPRDGAPGIPIAFDTPEGRAALGWRALARDGRTEEANGQTYVDPALRGTGIVVLDATPDPALAKVLGVEIRRWRVRDGRPVRRVWRQSAIGSRARLAHEPDQLREHVRREVERLGGKVLVCCSSKAQASVVATVHDPEWTTWIGATRGVNRWEGGDAVIVLGDHWPNMGEIERRGVACGIEDGNEYYRNRAEAEIVQALGRVRYVRPGAPVVLVLESASVVPGEWGPHCAEWIKPDIGRPRKVTDDDVRRALEEVGSVRKAAKLLGVSKSVVARARNGER